ncbi:transposase [Phaeobacter sp. B1627]|nr:transposase [Phaeobacter sp. B1627]
MILSILREFGHILPTGIQTVPTFAREHGTDDQLQMPEIADGILGGLCHQLNGLNARIDGLTKLIEQHAWRDADARRLMRMPGVGPITASAIVAAIGDAKQFETGRGPGTKAALKRRQGPPVRYQQTRRQVFAEDVDPRGAR